MEPTPSILNFSDYYKNLSELQGDLRNKVCDKLEISYKTFYNKINSDAWSNIEREAIAKIVEEFNSNLSNIL
jgi:hypothetical protein